MRELSLRKIVPTDSFIGQYMAFMSPQETAIEYDFWTAVWLMSLALGRETIIPRPRAPVHMNSIIFLVAESGITRKSTAVNLAVRVARLFNDRLTDPADQFEFITTRTTAESLENLMHIRSAEHGRANIVLGISEAIRLLGRERYLASMPGMLTDLYDSPSLHQSPGTLLRGRVSIRNIYLPVLSASTPSWLARAINPDVIEGGFTSRCLFVHSEKPKRRVAWPDEVGVGNESTTGVRGIHTEEQLAEKLYEVRRDRRLLPSDATGTTPGLHIRVDDGGMDVFRRWYEDRTLHRDPFRATFQSREDAHVLRIGGILSANAGRWIVNRTDVQNSIALIERLREDAALLFEGGAGGDKFALGIDRIRALLIDAGRGGLAHSPLYYKVRHYLNREEFSTIMDVLHQLEMVQVFESPTNKRGPRPVIYRATTRITGPGVYEALIKEIQP